MNASRPRRAGPLWLWLLGLVVLLVAIWIVVDQVAETDRADAGAAAPAAEVQGTADDRIREVESISSAAPIEALLPLGAADTGAQVRVDGHVADTAGHGAWIRTDRGALVFVGFADAGAALDDGDSVTLTGIVRADPDDRIIAEPPEAGRERGTAAEGPPDDAQAEADGNAAEDAEGGAVAGRAGEIATAPVRGFYVETTVDRIRLRSSR